MANSTYYMADYYQHHRTGSFPFKLNFGSFPVCTICRKDIYCDDQSKEWVCSDPECVMR